MYTRLKCAGQTQDAILKEHHVLPTWKAMNSNRKREEGTVKDVTMHTSNNKKSFCNFQNLVVM